MHKRKATVIVQPMARPSSPSVRLTALDEPTMTNAKKTRVSQPIFVMTGALKNGR